MKNNCESDLIGFFPCKVCNADGEIDEKCVCKRKVIKIDKVVMQLINDYIRKKNFIKKLGGKND